MRPSAAPLVLEVTARNGTTGASKNESLDHRPPRRTNDDNRRTGDSAWTNFELKNTMCVMRTGFVNEAGTISITFQPSRRLLLQCDQ
jgi:hypothetical protein